MKFLGTSLVAAMMAAAAALPAAALTSAEVIDAMDVRIGQLSGQISVLQAQYQAETDPVLAAALRRNIQILNVRRGQLISLKRIAPRYNERLLERLVTHYNLDVSPS